MSQGILGLFRGIVLEDIKARLQYCSPGEIALFKAILPMGHEEFVMVCAVKTSTFEIADSMLFDRG